jgi:hypothetical protein
MAADLCDAALISMGLCGILFFKSLLNTKHMKKSAMGLTLYSGQVII